MIAASPRPLRRTRLNSASIDLRTPTRTTRASLARAGTPETPGTPITLSSAKRLMRTPAKSARKQLVLKEEDIVELETEQVEARLSNEKANTSGRRSVTPQNSGERRVTRSMSKTPPVSGLVINNIAQPQFDMNNSLEENKKHVEKQIKEDVTDVVEESIVEHQSPTRIKESLSEYSTTSTSKRKTASKDEIKVKNIVEKHQAATGTPKAKDGVLQVKVKDVLIMKEQAGKVTPKAKGKDILEEQQAAKVTPKTKDVDVVLAKGAVEKQKELTGTPKARGIDLAKDGEQENISPKVKVKYELEKQQAVEITPNARDLHIDGEEEIAKGKETVTRIDEPVAAIQGEHEPDKENKEESPKADVPMPSTNKSVTSSKIPIPCSKKNYIEDDAKSIISVPVPPSDDQNDAAKVSTDLEITNEAETPVLLSKQNSINDDVGVDESRQATSPVSVSECKDTDGGQVTEEILLPNLTPKTVSRVIRDPTAEARKKVAFNSDSPTVETIKPTFPKTPARINSKPIEIGNIKPDCNIKSETPVKSFLKGRRNSSTPLAKPDAPKPKEEEPAQPLSKIDLIESLTSLESKEKPEISIKNQKSTKAIVSDSEEADSSEEDQEEDHDDDGEEEEDVGNSLFVDNEVEVVENYQSGDSMDSSERREIEENEIPNEGESVGSQDTVEEISEDEDEEKLSFIVSDDAVDDGDSRNSSLYFSTADEEDFIDNDGKGPKKRRRIVVHDSSDDSDEDNDTHKKFKSSNDNIKEEHSESLETSRKEQKAVAEKDIEKSVLVNKMNKSAGHDKTASPKLKIEEADAEEVDLTPTSPEMSCDEKETSNNISSSNKTIYEVFDSVEDTDDETTKDNSMSPTESNQPDKESDKEMSISKEHSTEESTSKDVEPTEENNEKSIDSEADSVAEPVKKLCKSSAFHDMQKNESEAALLSELASCDLSHLKKMFNPLQKSRRQTLYVQGSEAVATEPKQKASRRSEQLNIDFKPSQSFIETLAEKKRLQTKRTRISKSFCSATDDLEDSTVEEVQPKKAKNNDDSLEEVNALDHDMESPESLVIEAEQETKTDDQAKQQEHPKQTKTVAECMDNCESIPQRANDGKKNDESPEEGFDPDHDMESPDSLVNVVKQEKNTEDQAKQQEHTKQTKSTAEYMEYCESILQAANEAKLLQKKQVSASIRNKISFQLLSD